MYVCITNIKHITDSYYEKIDHKDVEENETPGMKFKEHVNDILNNKKDENEVSFVN